MLNLTIDACCTTILLLQLNTWKPFQQTASLRGLVLIYVLNDCWLYMSQNLLSMIKSWLKNRPLYSTEVSKLKHIQLSKKFDKNWNKWTKKIFIQKLRFCKEMFSKIKEKLSSGFLMSMRVTSNNDLQISTIYSPYKTVLY